MTVSYHPHVRFIYLKYDVYEPEGSYEIGRKLSGLSGYALELTPPYSAYAGYKDWFIQNYDRPGYTIEAGSGVSPLPLSQFNEIYGENVGMLTYAQTAAAGK